MHILDEAQLATATGGTSPFLKQLWAASAAKQWNQRYQATVDSLAFHGVPAMQRNSIAVQHADYLGGASHFPAPAIPYVTVGPHAIR